MSIRPFMNVLSIALVLLVCWLPTTVKAESIQRLISTDAGVTQLLFDLKVDQNLVAVDVTSHLPEGYCELENIGYHRNLSAEGLLSLAPSAVIGSEHMGPPPVVHALKAANVPLVQLHSATTTDQLFKNIETVAAAVNAQQQAKALAASLQKKLNQLENQHTGPLKTAFLLSLEPAKLRMAGSQTAADSFIELLGVTNVADFENYRTVSAESLMAMEPELIILVGKSPATAANEFLEANPIIRHSQAGKNQRILAIDGGSLVAGLSVQAVDEALRLANLLAN